MEVRTLGRTGLKVSVLGFGCGAVGGLMIRRTAAEQERAVARAVELGISYFDTAAFYGDGQSETNLGRCLAKLRPAVTVGTKVRIKPAERGGISAAITASLENSLRRLGREQVDLLQLHNEISGRGGSDDLTAAQVLDEVVPAFERLRAQGKIRFFGLSAKGEPADVSKAVASGAFDTAQVIYNLLNSSAGSGGAGAASAQDFAGLLQRTATAGSGVIAIRVLAGGALSGTAERDAYASPTVAPMGSGPDYAADVRAAMRFLPLLQEGHAGSLVEVAVRFAVAETRIATALVGFSTLAQLEHAAAAANKGPLAPGAVQRARALGIA